MNVNIFKMETNLDFKLGGTVAIFGRMCYNQILYTLMLRNTKKEIVWLVIFSHILLLRKKDTEKSWRRVWSNMLLKQSRTWSIQDLKEKMLSANPCKLPGSGPSCHLPVPDYPLGRCQGSWGLVYDGVWLSLLQFSLCPTSCFLHLLPYPVLLSSLQVKCLHAY